jgi:hypothetical protein
MNTCHPNNQRGVVAIVVALSLVALIGCAGLALDLGRLYVGKTELQNAVDACALAAANELVCEPGSGACPPAYLHNAEAAGIFAAGKNLRNFQRDPVAIGPAEVRFYTAVGPNGNYLARSDGADPASRFAMCSASVDGIVPWFMGMLGIGAQAVGATAVATLAPGQTACNAAPLGICSRGLAAPNFGRARGDWIASAYTQGGDDVDLSGDFRWINFTPGAADPVRNQLLGNGAACGIRSGDQVRKQTTARNAMSAWNTRFGIYRSGITPADAAPDRTGYAYPSSSIALNASAYADYRSKQAANAPFTPAEYTTPGAITGTVTTAANHLSHGAERRLVAVPVIDCAGAPANAPILAMACTLMLNPIENVAAGSVQLEWRGLAGDPASPCRSAGIAGGAGGALVATLVQ